MSFKQTKWYVLPRTGAYLPPAQQHCCEGFAVSFLFATRCWGWGVPVQGPGMGWLGAGPVLSCHHRRATQPVPNVSATNCHFKLERHLSNDIKAITVWMRFLGVRQGMGEVSTSWAVWLNDSSFVPQYTCCAYVDSCLLYFICMYEFYRKLYKSHIAFLKRFFEPAPDLRTLGKKGEGRCWGIDTCSSSWKWKSRSPVSSGIRLPKGQTWPGEPTRGRVEGVHSSAFECVYAVPYLWQHMLPGSLIIPGLIQSSE